MQSSYAVYDPTASVARLDEILAAADTNFEEADSIPGRDKLTFTNGFYVNCSALFIDIRKSAELNQQLKRPTLSRLYRSYISELVAIINGSPYCNEVNIIGDCVSGIFDTPTTVGINEVFSTAAQASSLINVLNRRLQQHYIRTIAVGIGMAWGRALMIKAGFKGSGINDVVYLGPVVNDASHLSNHGSSTPQYPRTMVSNNFRFNLNDHNQGLLSKNYQFDCYQGDIINTYLNSL